LREEWRIVYESEDSGIPHSQSFQGWRDL